MNYEPVHWSRIISALTTDSSQIHEINRASIIDDLLNLARSGYTDYSIALSATSYLKKETNYIPWRAAFNGLSYLTKRFAGRDINDLYKKHIQELLTPIYDTLGFHDSANDTHYTKLLRRYVINWSCAFDLKDCISTSQKLFANWRSNDTQIVPVNLRNTIYCTAIKHGKEEDWDFLWEKYLISPMATDKVLILNALGCSENKNLLTKLLMSAITENSGIRSQDSASVFSAVYSSGHIGANFMLDFIRLHHTDMLKYHGSYSAIESILSGVASQFSTEELVTEFAKFVKEFEVKMPHIEKSLVRAREELKWYDDYSPKIFAWFGERYKTEDYRLPSNILPVNYNVSLTPYFEDGNFTFDGEVEITMEVMRNTPIIVLHTNALNVSQVEVYEKDKLLQYLHWDWNSITHKFTIYLMATRAAGETLRVHIKYSGVLNNNMEGFYRSSYEDQMGNKR